MSLPMQDPNPQQHSELASFGEELRREREIRGISLKEIADATKISRRFLEAIEHNDHKTLPAPVFTRGFVREYARYLGLNAEEMVNRYNFAAVGDERIEKSGHLERLVHPEPVIAPKPLKKSGIPPAYSRIADRNILATLMIIAALSAVTYWAVRTKRLRMSSPAVAPVVAVVPSATIPPPAPREQGDLTRAPLQLTMEVTEDSWITLFVDDERVINDVLIAGTSRTFNANKAFRFATVGNAAGVTLTLNGKELPPLGRDGEVVRNRTFDLQSLETQP
jgi:cytoskeleton protein RodZ